MSGSRLGSARQISPFFFGPGSLLPTAGGSFSLGRHSWEWGKCFRYNLLGLARQLKKKGGPVDLNLGIAASGKQYGP
jgi:hypothetical protein